MKEWLAQYVPEAIATSFVAVVGFFGRRELKRIDSAHATNSGEIGKLGARVGALERSTVTRADFDELRGSLTASITNVGTRMEQKLDQQTALRDKQTEDLRQDQRVVLQHLLAMKGGASD